MEIIVIGLGPCGDEMMTPAAISQLRRADRVLLRWGDGPQAQALARLGIAFKGLDEVYNVADDLDELAQLLSARVLNMAREGGVTAFGVPGGGGIGDVSVCALKQAAADAGIPFRIIPGVGEAEALAASAGGVKEAAVLFASDADTLRPNPRLPMLMLEIDSRLLASDLKVKLLEAYPAQLEVLFRCQQGGAAAIALEDLDRQPESRYGIRAAVCIPAVSGLNKLQRFDFYHLMEVTAQLRSPSGCPWDREQTHESLKRYLVEETWETLSAIDEGDPDHLYDELGDVLLQIALHAHIGAEHADFDINDVTSAICAKMIKRHPHVFGSKTVSSSDEVLSLWDDIKREERGITSHADALREVPLGFPSLMRAAKVQKKAGDVGFDWANAADALAKVTEEAAEVAAELASAGEGLEAELGDLLFAVVNVARLCEVQPEEALTRATDKFIRRFSQMEGMARAQNMQLKGMSLAEMDMLWNAVKGLEGAAGGEQHDKPR